MSSSQSSYVRSSDMSLSGFPALLSSVSDPTVGYQPTMNQGAVDLDTLVYIGLPTGDIPERLKSRIKQLENMVMLTHSWLKMHTAAQVNKSMAEGALPYSNVPGA